MPYDPRGLFHSFLPLIHLIAFIIAILLVIIIVINVLRNRRLKRNQFTEDDEPQSVAHLRISFENCTFEEKVFSYASCQTNG